MLTTLDEQVFFASKNLVFLYANKYFCNLTHVEKGSAKQYAGDTAFTYYLEPTANNVGPKNNTVLTVAQWFDKQQAYTSSRQYVLEA